MTPMSYRSTAADICPLCKGSGKFLFPKKIAIDSAEVKKEIILALHAKGYSMRQIQHGVGYKSVRSVHKIIHANKSLKQ